MASEAASTVVSVEALSPSVTRVLLEVPADYAWIPGQHLSLKDEGPEARTRYYSIASAHNPREPGRLELAVGASSDGFSFVRGLRLKLSLPGGESAVSPGEGPLTLIANGTGVAPLRAVVQAHRGAQEITLLHGVRTRDERLFAPEFEECVRLGHLSYHPVLSRPDAEWRGLTGRVQLHLSANIRPGARYAVCGARQMVEDVVRVLEERGVDPSGIFAQGY